MLAKMCLDAVSSENFHIWPVARIEEGIELLTGHAADTVMVTARSRQNRLRQSGSAAYRNGRMMKNSTSGLLALIPSVPDIRR